MSVPGWLLGLVLPLCATQGVRGVPDPVAPASLRGIVRPGSPNHALAAPAGFSPAPDLGTRPYPVPAATLLAAVEAVASGEPRTFALPARPGTPWRRDFVARSAVFNFPDLVAVEILPGEASSGLVLWSRSVYGRSDLGANRRRVTAWLAALDARLGHASPAAAMPGDAAPIHPGAEAPALSTGQRSSP